MNFENISFNWARSALIPGALVAIPESCAASSLPLHSTVYQCLELSGTQGGATISTPVAVGILRNVPPEKGGIYAMLSSPYLN